VNVVITPAKYITVLIVLAWSTGMARGQQASYAAVSQPANQVMTQPAESDFDKDIPVPVPSIVSIDGAPLLLNSELEPSNYFRGGISVGSSYDDNVFSTSRDQVGGYALTAQPHVAFDVSMARLQLKTNYSGGFTLNQRLTSQNQGAHGLASQLAYRLTPHVTLSVHDNFAISTGFFNQVQNGGTGSGAGILHQSNGYVVTPLSDSTGNTGSVQLNYQFGAGSMVGISGTSYLLRYHDVPNGVSLLDTTGELFSGFYTHRVTPRNWVGVRYAFQRLDFDPVSERSTTQSVQCFSTIYLKRNMDIAFFAGPEYTVLDGHFISMVMNLPLVLVASTPIAEQHWSASGGTSFSWRGERMATQVQFVRRVTDGGGLQATVYLNGLSGEVTRQITPKTTMTLSASYANMDPLATAHTTYQVTDATFARIGVRHQLGPNLMFDFGYAHDWQKSASIPGPVDINHNRGWVTLSYDFLRPIGR
jgi:hypothetical protein